MSNTKKFFYQTEKNYKNVVPKYFAIFTGKHLCEIFKNSCFEEHLRTAASELALPSDLDFRFWIAFKTILKTFKTTKTSVAFKPEL